MTDEQIIWIKQIRKGNELAAYNIYNAYSKAMFNALIRITGDNEVSKDLLQEGFVKALKNINKLEDDRAFSGWLKRIIVNTGLEYVRKQKMVFEEIGSDHEELNEEVEERRITDEAIHCAIKELPNGCRTVLTLHLIEGYKHMEIANKLSISESTSKTQLRHAKKLLKEKLSLLYEN